MFFFVLLLLLLLFFRSRARGNNVVLPPAHERKEKERERENFNVCVFLACLNIKSWRNTARREGTSTTRPYGEEREGRGVCVTCVRVTTHIRHTRATPHPPRQMRDFERHTPPHTARTHTHTHARACLWRCNTEMGSGDGALFSLGGVSIPDLFVVVVVERER